VIQPDSKALSLNGYAFVEVPHSSIFDEMNNKFSISFWIRFTAEQDIAKVVSKFKDYTGFDLSIKKYGIRYYIEICACNRCVLGIRPIKVELWNHVAVTFNSEIIDGLKIYINGELDSKENFINCPLKSNNLNLIIGATSHPKGLNKFFGYIDELSLWSRDLSEREVILLQFQRLIGDEIDLISYWGFNQAGSLVFEIEDLSDNNLKGNVVGSLSFILVENKPLYVSEYN